jgi:hypothetical protein
MSAPGSRRGWRCGYALQKVAVTGVCRGVRAVIAAVELGLANESVQPTPARTVITLQAPPLT